MVKKMNKVGVFGILTFGSGQFGLANTFNRKTWTEICKKTNPWVIVEPKKVGIKECKK